MYITFLIGNGFDINLGLKTKYADFYDYYKEHAKKDSLILHWMQEDDDKGNWADLEYALGNKIEDVDEENLEAFMDSHAELDSLLLEYLETEQNKYSVDAAEKAISAEIARSLKSIPADLTVEDRNSFEATCRAFANKEFQYWFITFNYTDLLDMMIGKVSNANLNLGTHTAPNGQTKKHIIGEVHHVHGTMTEGVVLGVNDESQINNEVLSKNDMFKNIFLKRCINRQMGQRRTERAEEIINKSQIICIFGMSIGITDRRWWEIITTWLLASEHRKLLIYAREDESLFKRKIPTHIIRAREKVRRDFWEKGKRNQGEDIYRKIQSRIIVIFNSEIFSFPKVDNL